VDFSESTPVDHPDVLQICTLIQDRVTVVRHFIEEIGVGSPQDFLKRSSKSSVPISLCFVMLMKRIPKVNKCVITHLLI
jgi:hypothetical protein